MLCTSQSHCDKERHALQSHYTGDLAAQRFPLCGKLHSTSYDYPTIMSFKDNFLYYIMRSLSDSLASNKEYCWYWLTASPWGASTKALTGGRQQQEARQDSARLFSATAENILWSSFLCHLDIPHFFFEQIFTVFSDEYPLKHSLSKDAAGCTQRNVLALLVVFLPWWSWRSIKLNKNVKVCLFVSGFGIDFLTRLHRQAGGKKEAVAGVNSSC